VVLEPDPARQHVLQDDADVVPPPAEVGGPSRLHMFRVGGEQAEPARESLEVAGTLLNANDMLVELTRQICLDEQTQPYIHRQQQITHVMAQSGGEGPHSMPETVPSSSVSGL